MDAIISVVSKFVSEYERPNVPGVRSWLLPLCDGCTATWSCHKGQMWLGIWKGAYIFDTCRNSIQAERMASVYYSLTKEGIYKQMPVEYICHHDNDSIKTPFQVTVTEMKMNSAVSCFSYHHAFWTVYTVSEELMISTPSAFVVPHYPVRSHISSGLKRKSRLYTSLLLIILILCTFFIGGTKHS